MIIMHEISPPWDLLNIGIATIYIVLCILLFILILKATQQLMIEIFIMHVCMRINAEAWDFLGMELIGLNEIWSLKHVWGVYAYVFIERLLCLGLMFF